MKKISLFTATSLVIANMIGTGVFTSLGFQLFDIQSPFAILLLWITGGLLALCGALCYAELGSALPRSGSEYHYLSHIYHPVVGFMSGFISITVGFAAPVALAAMALGGYAHQVFPGLEPTYVAAGVILLLTAIHATSVKTGSGVQNIFTVAKILLILFIIIAGFSSDARAGISILPVEGSSSEILSAGFAGALYWVSYSYSGWNASAYIAGEIEDVQRNLPKSLLRGTLFVTILYVLLNFIFLYTTPADAMRGQMEVGYVAAGSIFGADGARIVGMIISILLVSSVSSMVMVGPRVAMVMGEDTRSLKVLATKSSQGIPWIAVLLQSGIALLLVFTASFTSVLDYIGFTLNVFTFLTVLGLILLRIREPHLHRPFKVWAFPLPPALFLLITGWILYYGLERKPTESLIGLGTIAAGALIYFIDYLRRSKFKPKKNTIA
ncbi:MAG: amino acid permease [Bacteroidia bacterium]|nr:amino acid permease [Bacteroidia bacterium]